MSITESKKPQPTSPETLAKTSPEGSVELTEAQLSDASGGAVFPSGPAASSWKLDSGWKLDSSLKIDINPVVKPGG